MRTVMYNNQAKFQENIVEMQVPVGRVQCSTKATIACKFNPMFRCIVIMVSFNQTSFGHKNILDHPSLDSLSSLIQLIHLSRRQPPAHSSQVVLSLNEIFGTWYWYGALPGGREILTIIYE